MDELELFCAEHGIEAEFIETPASAETAQDAARALDTDVEHIIKSLVFMVDGEPVLVVVRGPDQVDTGRLKEVLLADAVRMAEPDEVADATGYEIGGVPPVGTGLRAVVDERVLEMDEVYGGGGRGDRVIGLDPRFIVGEDDVVVPVTV